MGALRERDDTSGPFDMLSDKDLVTVVQIAPAVRAAWGESLGLPREKATVNRLVAALRRMGFRYVFDTNFSADLTIMEEGSEFLEHLAEPDSTPGPCSPPAAGLGPVPEEPVPGYGKESVHRQEAPSRCSAR